MSGIFNARGVSIALAVEVRGIPVSDAVS